jgi:hypothetical protein
MAHKFKIGQLVNYRPRSGLYVPRGPYLIAAQLPERGGRFVYRIRHPNEVHDRTVIESDLCIAEVATTTSEITEYMGYRLDARPVGKGWRVLIYPPETDSALSEYPSDLESSPKEAVIRRAMRL